MPEKRHSLFMLAIFIAFTFSCTPEIPCNKDTILCVGNYSLGRDIKNNCEFYPCLSMTMVERFKDYPEVRCGGMDTYGEVVCECSGYMSGQINYTEEICVQNNIPKELCYGGTYYLCKGTCGECKCYKGFFPLPQKIEEYPCEEPRLNSFT